MNKIKQKKLLLKKVSRQLILHYYLFCLLLVKHKVRDFQEPQCAYSRIYVSNFLVSNQYLISYHNHDKYRVNLFYF